MKNVYLIVGSAIVVGAIIFLRKKKIADKKIQAEEIAKAEETLKKDDTLFIIIKDDMNETLTNKLIHLWEADGIFIVMVNIKRLQFNILKHKLVPPHNVLNNTQVNEVMKKYNITQKQQFPDISRFDPVSQVIGLRPGKVCNIIRASKTSITADYYRICV